MELNDNIVVLDEVTIDYESVIANAVEGLFITTSEGRYLMVNQALADIYGYDSPEHLMNGITDIAAQLYVDASMRKVFVDQISQKGRLVNFEAEIYTRTGERKWIRENVRMVKDEDGNFLYFEGFVDDITELKRNKATIKEQNKELYDLNKNLEEKVEERTQELETQQKIVQVQNARLARLLHEVTRVKITRQATMIAVVITLALFLLTEGFVEPIIEGNYKNDFYISLAFKGLIALLIKPIEMLVEKILIRTRSRRLIISKEEPAPSTSTS